VTRAASAGCGASDAMGMDCWIVIGFCKLQNFAARSYRFATPVRVFHLPAIAPCGACFRA
jgi:hypothetical protein